MKSVNSIILFGAMALLVACSSSNNGNATPDSGAPIDLGETTDTGTSPTDSGTPIDSGAPTDAGLTGMCPMTTCDLIANTGCDTGQRCSVTSSALPVTTGCITSGAGDLDAACTDDTGCMPGLMCVTGQCLRMCCIGSTAGECGTGALCAREVTVSGMRTGIGICDPTDSCDLVAQSGCATGESCNLVTQAGDRLCRPAAGTLTQGMACDAAMDMCAQGLQCLQIDSGAPTCRKFCSTMDMASCATGETCGAIVVTGMPNLGVCNPSA